VGAPYCTRFELGDVDDGGVVMLVLLLRRLAGLVDMTGESGNGESEDAGEWDNGVVRSEILLGLCIWDACRGMGTPCGGRGA
jgi:hypothetical protein